MGTSFYLHDPARGQARHLGKRSGGWQFLYRAWPALGITGTESWRRQLEGAGQITDEYGRPWTAAELIALTEGLREGQPHPLTSTDHRDADGNTFCDREFC